MSTEKLTVAPGTRLLHVGPHKTGTTTVQGAFHRARQRLTAHGIVYAGAERQPQHAAAAITGARLVSGIGEATLDHWNALCAEVTRAANQTVVISSEYFSNGDDAAARLVVEGLGGPRVHVVVTLRPLLKIMPSQWQQYVQNGLRISYEEWLDGMLRRPPYDKPTPSFWRRHRHDTVVERWAEAVGPANLTVVVVDDADPLMQLRVFEQLLGLPDGFLVPDERTANRSLTLGEVELLRQLNTELRQPDWSNDRLGKVLQSLTNRMRRVHTPSPDDARIITPTWAQALAAEVSEEMVTRMSALGVRIVGDPWLLVQSPQNVPDRTAIPMVPSAAAVGAVLGALLADQPPKRKSPLLPAATEDRPVRNVRAVDLLRVVVRRGLRRVRRMVRRNG